jgi:hypothetical protein
LGKNGAGEVKVHPFFTTHNEWTWETIRNGIRINQFSIFFNIINLVSAPVVPSLSNDEDTSSFNEIEKHDSPTEESFSASKAFVGNQLSFIGFSYSNEQQ